ncbi:MAG: hypothetical protein PCFJNLEI_02924 [Verrucomicrobiae bacterium]|nr:hypothetical protein [Verrucomicrobiae bacterium]
MKAVMVMFDSLNRHLLPPYGCDCVQAPNFQRLAKRAVTFDTSYVCSMPCMPARRDLHTARPHFLHGSWGPLEPYDDSLPVMLRQHGVYTHLVSDHYHYWEDGGATYHNRYNSWEFMRGQEGDRWMGLVADPPVGNAVGNNAGPGAAYRHDRVNRQFMRCEADQPQTKTFAAGLDFIRRNRDADRWFLQIETFDPHEPFFTQPEYQELYRNLIGTGQPLHDWPAYGRGVDNPWPAQLRGHYAALVTMCDRQLGKVLDLMDELKLWDDTMLMVWTDHGFLLGEHECWAKCAMPFYEEVAHTPFFVWDPRGRQAGERRRALVQPALDLGPTLLGYFGVSPTADIQGRDLAATIAMDQPVREAGLFGIFGAQVNVTDGRYVYMRAPKDRTNAPLFNYTVMPMHMRELFSIRELQAATLVPPFSFTKGCPVLRMPGSTWVTDEAVWQTALYDLATDPKQQRPLCDSNRERVMIEHLIRLMRENDAPVEQYARLGLPS